MCGICGIVSQDKNKRHEPELLKYMLKHLRHRGPEAEGFWNENGAALAHARLKIIDPEGSPQPIISENGNFILVGNGEIYNYKELRKTLIEKDHSFSTNGDMETILHLYEEYGVEMLSHLHGMFAFFLWDKENQTAFFARDRMGQKPFYFSNQGTQLLFGSELKTIIAHPEVEREIDPEGIAVFLKYGYIPDNYTILKGIQKLPPAHFGLWKNNTFEIKRYWSPNIESQQLINPEELRILLESSVKDRLQSDVPLGIFLSGGIDSSIISICAKYLSSGSLKTFSIGFPEEEYNELQFAKKVAEQIGAEHHEQIVTPDALAVADKLAFHFDEPFADSSVIPMYYLSEMTAQHVTVVLSGDGGDELFGGYERYRAMNMADRMQKIPGAGKISKFVSQLIPNSQDFKGLGTRLGKFFNSVSLPPAKRYDIWQSVAIDEILLNITGDMVDKEMQKLVTFGYLQELFGENNKETSGETAAIVDINSYLPGDLLTKVDRTSMAHSLECRSPFMDHKLVKQALSIPFSQKIKGRNQKIPLKEAFAKELPPVILNRRKMGFGVPMSKWFRENHSLQDFLKDVLFSKKSINRGLLCPISLFDLAGKHFNGQADHSAVLWTSLMLELWAVQILDGIKKWHPFMDKGKNEKFS